MNIVVRWRGKKKRILTRLDHKSSHCFCPLPRPEEYASLSVLERRRAITNSDLWTMRIRIGSRGCMKTRLLTVPGCRAKVNAEHPSFRRIENFCEILKQPSDRIQGGDEVCGEYWWCVTQGSSCPSYTELAIKTSERIEIGRRLFKHLPGLTHPSPRMFCTSSRVVFVIDTSDVYRHLYNVSSAGVPRVRKHRTRAKISQISGVNRNESAFSRYFVSFRYYVYRT